ncbi:MAG: serine/threonine-protein kinase [Myxococcales bacterium]
MPAPRDDNLTAPELVVADRFALKRPLSSGGMGSVWVARHLTLHIDVALKFIDRELAKQADMRARFAQEAMAAAAINSRHVVRVIDHGVDERDRPYIAMELLAGMDLARRVDDHGPLSLTEVVRVVSQACRGLSRAHALGIIHRDLKPENLFLCQDEDEDGGYLVKILDFGVAKALAAFAESIPLHQTGSGELVGTPAFMSPEQALGQDVDLRSDLYSLAAVAYFCLAGHPPFQAASAAAMMIQRTTRSAKAISELRTDLPPDVDSWFARAMHRDPYERFESARDMAESFANVCAGAEMFAMSSTHTPAVRRALDQVVVRPPGSRARGDELTELAVLARPLPSLKGDERDSPTALRAMSPAVDDETTGLFGPDLLASLLSRSGPSDRVSVPVPIDVVTDDEPATVPSPREPWRAPTRRRMGRRVVALVISAVVLFVVVTVVVVLRVR